MKNENIIIIHHPGVYSIRDTFSGHQELSQILMQITKNTSIPDTYQKQLTQSLPDHYIVMVDGISVLLGTYYWGRVLLGTSMIL